MLLQAEVEEARQARVAMVKDAKEAMRRQEAEVHIVSIVGGGAPPIVIGGGERHGFLYALYLLWQVRATAEEASQGRQVLATTQVTAAPYS